MFGDENWTRGHGLDPSTHTDTRMCNKSDGPTHRLSVVMGPSPSSSSFAPCTVFLVCSSLERRRLKTSCARGSWTHSSKGLPCFWDGCLNGLVAGEGGLRDVGDGVGRSSSACRHRPYADPSVTATLMCVFFLNAPRAVVEEGDKHLLRGRVAKQGGQERLRRVCMSVLEVRVLASNRPLGLEFCSFDQSLSIQSLQHNTPSSRRRTPPSLPSIPPACAATPHPPRGYRHRPSMVAGPPRHPPPHLVPYLYCNTGGCSCSNSCCLPVNGSCDRVWGGWASKHKWTRSDLAHRPLIVRKSYEGIAGAS